MPLSLISFRSALQSSPVKLLPCSVFPNSRFFGMTGRQTFRLYNQFRAMGLLPVVRMQKTQRQQPRRNLERPFIRLTFKPMVTCAPIHLNQMKGEQ
ncbi:hypothetical protein PILCRDRAFT_128005 [Piloderma croceum F 1598]|uniref:Uncharacterized protein n=1 Tax=Piloderma croceum (strain F 1598) TaxID=765440 RepID=A0A0C3G536_PILCF|nr:hypothetical protein PILCRDRAFT_128005 [Piloderma croceum F 1598]